MGEVRLGELRDVPVREVWQHEALNFTPWLAENLDQLSETLGVDLELEDTEVRVGPFRADILCRIPQDGTEVLIENQLEHADLQHLGQVLAYLAGLEAKIVIWIARGFDDPHRSALRWLNEHTPDRFAFFAVKVGVVKIGDSLPAPVFEVIERPNEWDRQVRDIGASLSNLGKFRRDFWAHFSERRPDAPRLRPGYAGSNVYHAIDQLDVLVGQYIAKDHAGLFIVAVAGDSDEDLAARLRPYLQPLRRALEQSLAADGLGTVDSDRFREDAVARHMCWIGLYADTKDRDNWDQIADWLDSRRTVYEAVLREDPLELE